MKQSIILRSFFYFVSFFVASNDYYGNHYGSVFQLFSAAANLLCRLSLWLLHN